MDRCLLTCAYLILLVVIVSSQVPPKMTFSTDDVHYLSETSVVSFKCHAEGDGIKYTWKHMKRTNKDTKIPPEFSLSSQNVVETDMVEIKERWGSSDLIITKPDATANGYYKCYAQNSYGVAMSNTFEIILARLTSFGDSLPVTMTYKVGDYVKIPCLVRGGVARAVSLPMSQSTYTWLNTNELLDPNVISDLDGNLHILSISEKDDSVKNSKDYNCALYNQVLSLKSYGTEVIIKVNPGSSTPKSVSSLDGLPKTEVQAFMGNNSFTLQCIPNALPSDKIIWKKLDDTQWVTLNDPSRIKHRELYKYDFTIINVQENDQGKYRCYAPGTDVFAQFSVKVYSKPIVEAIPDIKMVTGSSKKFECSTRSANGHYRSTIYWYKNGAKFTRDTAPPKIKHFTDSIVLSNVDKNDAMSLACVATNPVGETTTTFTVSVIDATQIVNQVIELKEHDNDLVTFNREDRPDSAGVKVKVPVEIKMKVTAVADPLVAADLQYSFFINGTQILSKNPDDQMYINPQKRDELFVKAYDKDENRPLDKIFGNYTCLVSVPGVSNADVPVSLIYLIRYPVEPGPVVVPAAFPFWIIGLVIGLILLLLVIFLIVCVMYRNRGGIWKVDEKERAAGNDIDKELADSGFHDLGRADGPEEEKKPIDQRSLSDDDLPPGEDTASLDEYGEPDMSKFNEEGSFIEMYGKPPKSKSTSSEPQRPENLTFRDGPRDYNNSPPPSYAQHAYSNDVSGDTMV